MDLAAIVGAWVLAVSPFGVSHSAAGVEPSLPEPISTRQTMFSIPFQVAPTEQPGQEPVEVQLHVSVDRGVTWHFYSKVKPERQHFLFRAGGDGEFWFLIRTLDGQGQLRPRENGPPGLRVVVDSTPPKLQLTAEHGTAGQVTARWEVEDRNFDPSTLKLRYRTAANPAWQFVAVDARNVTTDQTTHQGEVTWWIGSNMARVEVRAEAADSAGNPAVTHAQIAPATSSGTDRVAGGVPADVEPVGPSPERVSPRPDSWHPSTDAEPDSSWQARLQGGPSTAGDLAAAEPSPREPPPSPIEPAQPFPKTSDTDQPYPYANDRYSVEVQPSDESTGDRYDRAAPPESDKIVALPDTREGSVAIQIHPPIRNQYVTPEASPAEPQTIAGVPEDAQIRMVQSRIFELEYDVESVGPSGLTRVELWGTRNGGRTWSSFGVDNDRRSPVLATVHEDGVYGFCVVVTNGAGLGGKKPRRGDKADVWIGVDQTEPRVKILPPQQIGDSQAGRLIIQWEAEDPMLSDRPVSLYFSKKVGGPWKSIAADLENSGEYVWPLDRYNAERLYLRIEVRDKAGNVGVSETQAAIRLTQLQPMVHIRDVRPLSDSDHVPAKRYFVR